MIHQIVARQINKEWRSASVCMYVFFWRFDHKDFEDNLRLVRIKLEMKLHTDSLPVKNISDTIVGLLLVGHCHDLGRVD